MNLSPYSGQSKGELITSKGYFTFKQTDLVSFPFSPFIIKYLFDIGNDESQMKDFICLSRLNNISEKMMNNYFYDAICIGCGLQRDRLDLLKQIVNLLYKEDVFTSLISFHSFLNIEYDWLKVVIKFASKNFHPDKIEIFLNHPSLLQLQRLASINGVVPLDDVETLRQVTKEDSSIDWRIIRAMSMADIHPHLYSEEEKVINQTSLSNIYEAFKEDEQNGLIEVFKGPPIFIKYFLFEVFTSYRNTESETQNILVNTLSSICDIPEINLNIHRNESLRCGVASLLRTIIHRVFIKYEKSSLDVLNKFMTRGIQHYILLSHCVFNVLFENEEFVNEHTINQFKQDDGISFFIRFMIGITLCVELIDFDEDEDIETMKNQLSLVLENNPRNIRETTLFIVRQLTCGGTSGVKEAIKTIQTSNKFPKEIEDCPVLIDILNGLIPVSPLACLPDFSKGLTMVNNFSSETNRQKFMENFNDLDICGRMAVASACYLSLSPADENFKNQIYPLLVPQFPSKFNQCVNKFQTDNLLQKHSKDWKQNVLHMCLLNCLNHPIIQYYTDLAEQYVKEQEELRKFRLKVEDELIPKCPRCKKAFIDWTGCFAVYCGCGCSFCGHCLQDCGTDAHSHVRSEHGSYHGQYSAFQRGFGAIATQKIKSILDGIPDNLRNLMEEDIPNIIKGNEFFIKPESILKLCRNEENNNQGNNLPVVRALTDYFSEFGFIWLHILGNTKETDSLAKICRRMNDSILKIRDIMFPESTTLQSTVKWIHAILSEIYKKDIAQPLNRILVEEIIKEICVENQDTLTFLGEFEQQCTPVNEVIKELQMNPDKILCMDINDEELKVKFLSLPRKIISFSTQFWTYIKENFDKFPIFNLLRERESVLDKSKGNTLRCYRIAKFISTLTEAATERKISREQANQEGSFFEFIAQCGDPLVGLVEEFKRDFKEIFPLVLRWECNDKIQNIFSNLKEDIPKELKLSCFLPTRKDLGILSMALWSGREKDEENSWTGLPNIQNQMYNIIHPDSIRNPPKEISPYHIKENDVINIDFEEIIEIVNSLFIVPDYQDKLSDDLEMIEELVKSGTPQLNSLPYLQSTLPEFGYGLEGIQSLMKKLQNRLQRTYQDFTTLPSGLAFSLLNVINNAPHAAELIFSFCGAILLQIGGDDDNGLLDEVSKINIRIPLTEEQEQGKQILSELPGVSSEFMVKHIPALMGLCWSKKPIIHKSVDYTIEDPDLIQQIRDGFEKFIKQKEYHPQIPELLTSLRYFGMSMFCLEQNEQYSQTPLSIFLESSIIEHEFLDDFEYIPPFSCMVKYYGSIYHIAEEILSPKEFESINLQNQSKLIPFAAIRQFLKSHNISSKDNQINPKQKENQRNISHENKDENNESKNEIEESSIQTFTQELTWSVSSDILF